MASTDSDGRRAVGLVPLIRTAYLLASGVLLACVLWRPGLEAAISPVLGVLSVAAVLLGIRIHPYNHRAPLWWIAAALSGVFAAQVCALIGSRHGAPVALLGVADLLGLIGLAAAAGALITCLSRRVPGWDTGVLLDLVIVVGALGASAWLYFIGPRLIPSPISDLQRSSLTAYPTAALILLMLSGMFLMRLGVSRPEAPLLACGAAGLVLSTCLLLVTRLHETQSSGYWRSPNWVEAGWLLFQLSWGAALLHLPGMRCVSAPGAQPHRQVTVRRLITLIVIALVNPMIFDIQAALGPARRLNHFPILGGTVFVAVIVRLTFIGADHLRSIRRQQLLLDAQTRIVAASSATELARTTAHTAAALLGASGEVDVVFLGPEPPIVARMQAPNGPGFTTHTPADIARWRVLGSQWPRPHTPGRPFFPDPGQLPYFRGEPPADAMVCPIDDEHSRRSGRPLGLLTAAGAISRVASAANALAILAAQSGQGHERLGMIQRLARSHLSAMTANIADAILIVDDDGVIRYANPATANLVDAPVPPGTPLARLIGAEHATALSATGQTLRHWHLPGTARVVEAVIDDRRTDPTVGGYVLTLRDVTKIHALENELHRRATRDPETGLENRAGFVNHLSPPAKSGVEQAVLALALDDVAELTSSFGPWGGKQAIEQTAQHLASALRRERPALARVDAATLAMLLTGCPTLPTVAEVHERVRSALREPVEIAGHRVSIKAGAGYALRTRAHQGEELLADAILAAHDAQQHGPHGFTAYSPHLRSASREQAEMISALNHAMASGAFSLSYQPILALDTELPVTAEALIRWKKPGGDTVSPDAFIPFAEQSGQIVPLGEWVIGRALTDQRSWPYTAGPDGTPVELRVNINVSPIQLRTPGFLSRLRTLMARTETAPSSVVLEVTESGIVEQTDILAEARALGIRVAMDDFGTGYSSLSSLRRLPITSVKIDKAFVDGIATDQVQFALVEGIVRIARDLGLNTVAEGVETREQHERLREAGCEYGQGFLYSRPLPSPEFTRWLESHVPAHADSTGAARGPGTGEHPPTE